MTARVRRPLLKNSIRRPAAAWFRFSPPRREPKARRFRPRVELRIDGTQVGSAMCRANQNNNHIALRPTFIPYEGLTIGTHTIDLNPYGGTITDVNDYFQVTMLY